MGQLTMIQTPTPKIKAYIDVPPKLQRVLAPPLGTFRYRGAFGGRGSAKSMSFAQGALVHGYLKPLRILCGREFHTSIKESFLAELANAVNLHPWMSRFYDVGDTFLRGLNGTEFVFKGLRRVSPKSLAQFDLCIIEEAEEVPEQAWRKLTPTIRKPGSEIWIIWNPETRGSACDIRFRQNTPPRSYIVEINYQDNPFFTGELEEERAYDEQILDAGTYAHVWDGDYLENHDAQILSGKWIVKEFEIPSYWNGPYQGIDFGFSQDPLAAVRCYEHDGYLYVTHEAGKRALELDETSEYILKRIEGFSNYRIGADSSRPESISHLSRKGLPKIYSAPKWPGSVEDGIAHLRSYKKIVIHPRCKETVNEAKLYCYKVDDAGNILSNIVDAYNHYIDALRYALAPLIKAKKRAGALKGSRHGNKR